MSSLAEWTKRPTNQWMREKRDEFAQLGETELLRLMRVCQFKLVSLKADGFGKSNEADWLRAEQQIAREVIAHRQQCQAHNAEETY